MWKYIWPICVHRHHKLMFPWYNNSDTREIKIICEVDKHQWGYKMAIIEEMAARKVWLHQCLTFVSYLVIVCYGRCRDLQPVFVLIRNTGNTFWLHPRQSRTCARPLPQGPTTGLLELFLRFGSIAQNFGDQSALCCTLPFWEKRATCSYPTLILGASLYITINTNFAYFGRNNNIHVWNVSEYHYYPVPKIFRMHWCI